MGEQTSLTVEQLVDLDRYPIHRLEYEAGRALIARCRQRLATNNACNLPNFLRVSAIEALQRETESWYAGGYEKLYAKNAYHTEDDPSLPAAHPARRFEHNSNCQLAYDQIPETSLLDQLYRWPALTQFIATALGFDKLFRMADRFQALNVIWLRRGESSTPHFDFNDFTITLLLEAAHAGGEFEFAPDIRTSTDEHYDAVERVLDGDRSMTKTLRREAGTLTLFRGRNSLHWVTPVRAGRRTTAILCYDEKPNCLADDSVNLKLYGERIRPLLAANGLV